MAGKLLGGALDAVSAAAGAVSHLAWYVSYHVDGPARAGVTLDARDRR